MPASFGMLLFGLGWTSAFATIQAAAQLVCPPWVRARALSIYQLAQNGALTIGSFGWGWLGDRIGISHTFLTASVVGLLLMVVARISASRRSFARRLGQPVRRRRCRRRPRPNSCRCYARRAAGSWRWPTTVSNRTQRLEFLTIMDELHHVRGRAGAVFWQVYEDVAHPDGWVEVWFMESWTDHLREVIRLSDDDKRLLAAAAVFQHEAHRPSRYLAVDPHEYRHAHQLNPPGREKLPVVPPPNPRKA